MAVNLVKSNSNASDFSSIPSVGFIILSFFFSKLLAHAALLVGTQSSTIWSKVRSRLIDYFGVNGHDLDRAWFSKVEANIDNDSKTLNLKAPSSFVKDWITERYSHLLERFCYQEQYSLVLV